MLFSLVLYFSFYPPCSLSIFCVCSICLCMLYVLILSCAPPLLTRRMERGIKVWNLICFFRNFDQNLRDTNRYPNPFEQDQFVVELQAEPEPTTRPAVVNPKVFWVFRNSFWTFLLAQTASPLSSIVLNFGAFPRISLKMWTTQRWLAGVVTQWTVWPRWFYSFSPTQFALSSSLILF